MSPTIILPGEVTRKFRYRCFGCDKGFYEHEARAWMAHVAKCCDDERTQEMLAELKRRQPFPDIGDAEYESWVRKHADEILEGRLRM